MRHGSGRLTLSDGTTYDGQWREDKLHGAGVCMYAGPGGVWGVSMVCCCHIASHAVTGGQLCWNAVNVTAPVGQRVT